MRENIGKFRGKRKYNGIWAYGWFSMHGDIAYIDDVAWEHEFPVKVDPLLMNRISIQATITLWIKKAERYFNHYWTI